MRALLGLCLVGAVTGCAENAPPSALPRPTLLDRALSANEPPPDNHAYGAILFAMAQVGKPYCWGGTGPSCFDCSGLVNVAWAGAGGVRLPRTSSDMAARLPEVPLDQIRAGDILWWPGHVGLYTGNGWMIDAYDSRHGVVQRPVVDPKRAFRPTTRDL